MSDSKPNRPKARLPRGFRDRTAADIAAERAVLETVRRVYESYGFSALETPAFEYTDALGKFLPDLDRPNEGVFSLQDDDGRWLSLRYDLTAPLARYVAANYQTLTKPFRRYQLGPVWRNEKPGPGRFREFLQFDADTVGSASPSADAELLMMLSDALEALGLKNKFVIKINNRKILDGLLEGVGLPLANSESLVRRGIVLRALDKLDRLGIPGVFDLLRAGRKDESGDFTKGAGLSDEQAKRLLDIVTAGQVVDSFEALTRLRVISPNQTFQTGVSELLSIVEIIEPYARGYPVQVDTSVIRGLDYYTGAVFEAQLTFPVQNESGETVVFGSVAGGGRYDDLVARFTGQTVPATGVSIGVSRLISALSARGLAAASQPLIVVTVMDKADAAAAFKTVAELRAAGLRAEAYVGTQKFGDQMKYADRRGAAIAVIEGGDERAKGEVTIKDLALGAELAKSVESRAAWTQNRQAQLSVKRGDLVAEIKKLLQGRS